MLGEFLFNLISEGFLERLDFHGLFLATRQIQGQTFVNEDFFVAGLQEQGFVQGFQGFSELFLGHEGHAFADEGVEMVRLF